MSRAFASPDIHATSVGAEAAESAPGTVAGESDAVFEQAAELFRVMSTPMRLKIISALCNGERSVSELLLAVPTTQPNMSQHLSALLQAGVVARRRHGVRMLYRIANDRVVTLCRAVCTQIAIDSDWAEAAPHMTAAPPDVRHRERTTRAPRTPCPPRDGTR
jgi:DNA-binding transcriptional ArsR family regulator